jgi:serine O-acetyltransferase
MSRARGAVLDNTGSVGDIVQHRFAVRAIRGTVDDRPERGLPMSSKFAEEVFRVRNAHAAVFPSRRRIHRFVDDLEKLLFPHVSSESEYYAPAEIDGRLAVLSRDLKRLIRPQQKNMPHTVDEVAERFFAALPDLYRRLWMDARAIDEGDPASQSLDEVISAYPGFFAIYTQRIAHELHALDVPILPRMVTEYAHLRTGIDIHPGAQIGDSFCIDHGTGIVIGETTLIGNNVKIYQGVSLGALSVSKEQAKKKRHPTVEDNVVVYSGATILGGDTVIGHDSVIGGNVWLTESVPPHSVVYHKSEVKVRSKNNKGGRV